jgi:formylglycine-generating enzyme required for sulfatase activity
MGCLPDDTECGSDEKPAHEVTITRGYWLGQTPVTQAAYERVMGGANPSFSKGADLPVEEVTWDDTRSYCRAVGGRLPTEAEWEYAARAGSTASRYGAIEEISWYGDNSGRKTNSVGKKKANAWKLYDMLGNVWEWTADWYDQSYYATTNITDPQGPSEGTRRTLRGGAWDGDTRSVRVSARNGYEPSSREANVGFRCAGKNP